MFRVVLAVALHSPHCDAGSPIFNINHARHVQNHPAFNTKNAIVSMRQNCRGCIIAAQSTFYVLKCATMCNWAEIDQ
jgi:hypothetical protein